jgi:hypothetical protein
MLLLALALVLTAPPDLRTASAAYVPAGARISFASERDATFGIVAWTVDGRVGARALEWRGGRWRPAPAGRLRIRPAPAAGSQVRQPALVRIRGLGGGAWIDGRPAVATGGDYILLRGFAPGPHVFVAFASDGSHAVARAWTYRLR